MKKIISLFALLSLAFVEVGTIPSSTHEYSDNEEYYLRVS